MPMRYKNHQSIDNIADHWTYSEYSRIVWHLRLLHGFLLWLLLNPQIFDIATTEYDVFINIV